MVDDGQLWSGGCRNVATAGDSRNLHIVGDLGTGNAGDRIASGCSQKV